MTIPLPTLGPTVSSTGISIPSYDDVLASLQAMFQSIYGTDTYLAADSQDGQWLAAIALAITDVNNSAVAVYNAFSPSTAQGAGLSSVVKINGLERDIPTNSTVNVTITGDVGTVITNGVVADSFGNLWNLPGTVTIPIGASIIVTATAQELGNIAAAPGSVTVIKTPTRGWASVTNAASATAGAPVENDPQLRGRQSISTAQPARGITSAILAGVENVAGVQRAAIYENSGNTTDSNGVHANTVYLVAQGGDAMAVAAAIALRKPPGTGTQGNTTESVTDEGNVTGNISFDVMTAALIKGNITGTALAGYASTTADKIKAAFVAYIGNLAIGEDVYRNRLFAPITLPGTPDGDTFNITAFTIAKNGGGFGTADLTINANEGAGSDVGNVTVTIT